MATKAEDVELLDIKAASAVLGCSKNHTYRLIASGELPAVDIALPGSVRPKTRVRSDHIQALIKRRTRNTA